MRNVNNNIMVNWLDDVITDDEMHVWNAQRDTDKAVNEFSSFESATLKAKPIEASWNDFKMRLKQNNSKSSMLKNYM